MSIEAMKQALEALEWAGDQIDPVKKSDCDCPLCTACLALDAAIEQAEKHEPVAWIEHHKGGDNLAWEDPGGKRSPLYTAPPQRQPLTDEQWQVMADTLHCAITRTQKNAIEAALGIGGGE